MAVYTGRPIDESLVLLKKRDHPEYRRLYSKLLKELSASKSIEIYCDHEAGHLIFAEKAGYTQFIFHGPTMTYNATKQVKDESERYNYFVAAVEALETSHIQHYDNKVLSQLARCAVAGELFNEIRDKQPPVPIDRSSDFDSFDEHCRKALRNDNSFGYDAPGRWKRARIEVKAYLNNNPDKAEIQSAIAKIKYECFWLR